MKSTPNPPRSQTLKFVAIGLLALSIGLVSWIGFSLYRGQTPLGGGTGTALVGGAFTATDHTGKAITEKDFHDRYMLAYFGYTFCPDVCPGELQIIGAAMDLIGEKAEQIRPVFFTVDPARDTAEVLADYVPHFHDRMIGVTGTTAQMAAVAKAYRVYYAKVKAAEEGGVYLMDHSSLIYLMDRDGKYVRHFNYGTPPEDIAKALNEILS